MLSKDQRLRQGFPVIFRKGVRLSTPFFTCRAVAAWDGVSRFAVSVSSKTEKTAVRRNRIRRRLSEAARAAGFPEVLSEPCRIVLLGRSEVLSADFDALVREVRDVFHRLESCRFSASPPRAMQKPG